MYASYHFGLDNGDPIPERMFFKGASFDKNTRTFRGTIDWRRTPINGGDHSWTYTMIFSQDMRYIEGGSVVMKAANGQVRETMNFGSDLIYNLKETGRVVISTLVLKEEWRVKAGSYTFTIEAMAAGGAMGWFRGQWCIGDGDCEPEVLDCKKATLVDGYRPDSLCLPKPGSDGIATVAESAASYVMAPEAGCIHAYSLETANGDQVPDAF